MGKAITDASFDLEGPKGMETVAMRNAMNEVTRLAYVKDCEIGLKRWNMQIKRAGYELQLTLPSTHFRRSIGVWAGVPTTPEGRIISQAEFDKAISDWIPTDADRSYVKSLMQRVTEPGKMAGWVAPPDRGINNLPVDRKSTRLNSSQ